LARQDREHLHTTSITEAEILLGLELMPKGRRGDELERATLRMFQVILSGRVLPFDRAAARAYALIFAERQKIGRPIKQPDAQIAAIARSRGAAVATRNIADFEHCGIKVIDPWTA
jgi:predicted nucleic acid-binding protein